MNDIQSKLAGLRRQVLRLLLLRLLLPMLLFTFIIMTGAGYIGEKNLESQQQLTAKSLSRVSERYLDQGIRIINAISAVSTDISPEELHKYVSGIWNSYKYFETVYIVDSNLTVKDTVPYDRNMLGLDLSNIPDVRKDAIQDAVVISRPFISLRTGDPTVYLIRKFSADGLAVGELNLSVLQDEIQKEKAQQPYNIVYIMDQNGTLLAHPDINQVRQQMNLSDLSIFKKGKAADMTMLYRDAGTLYLGSSTQVPGVGWVVVSQMPVLTLFAPFIMVLAGTMTVFFLIWLGVFNNLRKQLQDSVVEPLFQQYNQENLERMKAEEAVQKTEIRFRTIFDQTYQHIGLLDREGRVIESNQALRLFVGVNDTTEKGQFFWNTILWRHSPLIMAQIKQAVQRALTGQFVRQEATAFSADGTLHVLDVSFKPVLDTDGSVSSLIIEGHDITELKNAEEALLEINDQLEARVIQRTHELEGLNDQLKEAKNQADRANTAKTAFLANMSHELRTPLNAILGFSELMSLDKTLPVDAIGNLKIINRSGEHLLTLINDVLDLSKIEAGQADLNLEDMDLRKMVQGLHELFQVKADKKAVQLNVIVEPEVPSYIHGDEKKLRQILINLLGNALKFTDAGSVTFRLEEKERNRESNSCVIRFTVQDTGYGIALDEQEDLFNEYVQGQRGRQSENSTGLGLAIASRFVALMGSDLRFTSDLGYGTTFFFDLSVQEVGLEQPITENNSRAVGLLNMPVPLRILIVDDEQDNRALMNSLLKRFGFLTQDAENGLRGVELWEAWNPDLIFMDMRMSVMNGYDATKQIRSREAERVPHEYVPIVAVSASCFEDDRVRIEEAGCDDFMMKPFSERELCIQLSKHLRVEFNYETIQQPEIELVSVPTTFTAEDLMTLPHGLLSTLADATNNLITSVVTQCIRQIHDEGFPVAEYFSELAADFRYDEIYDLCKGALALMKGSDRDEQTN